MKLSRRKFEALVVRALETIPEPIRARMDNVDVVIEDRPSPDQLTSLDLSPDEELFGLYEGTPLIERGITANPLMPDKITIFQRALEAGCETEADITEEVRRTIVHEVAHHFGFNEEKLAELGYD
ncbi:MAG TPA: metallopeptidase family protein [bacterium]|jgi:predicted Zn-dependent protease with MMP-like domain